MSNTRHLMGGSKERESCRCSNQTLIIAGEIPRQRDVQRAKGNKFSYDKMLWSIPVDWLYMWTAVSVAEELSTRAHLAHWEHRTRGTLNKIKLLLLGFFSQVLSRGFKNSISQRERRQESKKHWDLREEWNWGWEIILWERKNIFQLDKVLDILKISNSRKLPREVTTLKSSMGWKCLFPCMTYVFHD